jgi:hypothetical protein
MTEHLTDHGNTPFATAGRLRRWEYSLLKGKIKSYEESLSPLLVAPGILTAVNLKVNVGAATAGAINATAAPHASPISISLEKRFITLLLAFNTNLPSQEERDFITIPTFPTL